MKNNIIIQATLLSIALIGIIAAATLLLSSRSGVTMETVLGFGIVFALLRGAAMEYQHSGKRALSR